jgi:NADH-quinone oxidoreductase subunit C
VSDDVEITGEDVYLARTEADEAALAVGFSLATGAEVATSRDGFGVPVIDVPRAGWAAAAMHARDVLGMDFADWLSAVDQPDREPAGVDVVLHVVSTASAGSPATRLRRTGAAAGGVRRLLLRTGVPDADLVLTSLTDVWPGLAWHERETFEMFGVTFEGFADGLGLGLRPLLLPEGFEGTPLRKSFVLAARASKPWPGAKEPGEGGESAGRSARSPGRRKTAPPGVPDPSWGPREPAAPDPSGGPDESSGGGGAS